MRPLKGESATTSNSSRSSLPRESAPDRDESMTKSYEHLLFKRSRDGWVRNRDERSPCEMGRNEAADCGGAREDEDGTERGGLRAGFDRGEGFRGAHVRESEKISGESYEKLQFIDRGRDGFRGLKSERGLKYEIGNGFVGVLGLEDVEGRGRACSHSKSSEMEEGELEPEADVDGISMKWNSDGKVGHGENHRGSEENVDRKDGSEAASGRNGEKKTGVDDDFVNGKSTEFECRRKSSFEEKMGLGPEDFKKMKEMELGHGDLQRNNEMENGDLQEGRMQIDNGAVEGEGMRMGNVINDTEGNPRGSRNQPDSDLRMGNRRNDTEGNLRGLRNQLDSDLRMGKNKEIDLESVAKMEEGDDAEAPKEMGGHGFQELTLSYMRYGSKPPVIALSKAEPEAEAGASMLWEKSIPTRGVNAKDKGKQLALSLSNETEPTDYSGRLLERDFLQLKGNHGEEEIPFRMERGASSRYPPREEIEEVDLYGGKQRQKKLKTEPLQLSLGLPDVSLTLASQNPNMLPASSGRARSVQSLGHTNHTRTSSHGFTTSLEFSESQTFVHNPSCSFNQNSMDNYEYSVGSHPVSQGNDQSSHGNWQVPNAIEQASPGNSGSAQERCKPGRDISLYQRVLQNGNMQGNQSSQGAFGGNNLDRNPFGNERGSGNTHSQFSYPTTLAPRTRSLDESQGKSNGSERQFSFPRELPERTRQEAWSSPSQSVSSRETRSIQHKQNDKNMSKPKADRAILFQRDKYGRDGEQSMPRDLMMAERILFEIVSEPITTMAQKFQELPDNILEDVREYLWDLIGNNENRDQLANFQKVLQKRSDLTSETLIKSHRKQLEILVALKTGIQTFLHRNDLQTTDLADIFLDIKCRNLACNSQLPVDDCECKICSQRSGFCYACMCLICSKFDCASNTCSWVGCDFCLHWCHTDCGIRMSYIKPGPSIKGAPGTMEMQFHCIACDHSSEMFGFVKEVFKTCAKDWSVETLAKELDCVRRIFRGSEDFTGKKLRNKAKEMLVKLESKDCAPAEVCDSFLLFLTECDFNFHGTTAFSVKEPVQQNRKEDACDQFAVAVRESIYKINPISSEKVGNKTPTVPQTSNVHEGKKAEVTESHYGMARNNVEIDELESIVRIKQAEAKMFQTRADDARREAEGLKRIALVKNDKIEEEYTGKLAMLCLTEAEERRRQKLEELKIIESAQRDYYNMKMRMETDIKELLRKMEMTRRQFL